MEDSSRGKKDKDLIWYLVIDSRSFENTINCENIEEFSESKDGYLNLTYYIPGLGNSSKFTRKQEQYDCCENKFLLKTFMGIRKRIAEGMGGQDAFNLHLQKLSGGEIKPIKEPPK